MQTAGLRNVFGELDGNATEVNLEEVLTKDPDMLILIHTNTRDAAAIQDDLRALPGADRLSAVRNGDVLTLRLEYTNTPTPLAVQGLERIAAHAGRSP